MKKVRLLVLFITLTLILQGIAFAAEDSAELLWLHGNFDGFTVAEDGFVLEAEGIIGYEKILSSDDVSIYVAGRWNTEPMGFDSPESVLGDDTPYDQFADVSISGYPAMYLRYTSLTDEGVPDVRWDHLLIEVEDFVLSIMIGVPSTNASDFDTQIDALIASMALKAETPDSVPMLQADFEGFKFTMDQLAGDESALGRSIAYTDDTDTIAVTLMRGETTESPYTSFEAMREAFLFGERETLESMDIKPIASFPTERWRYAYTMNNGRECRADAIFIMGEEHSYVAMIGKMEDNDSSESEYDAIIDNLIASLTLE